jgi:translation initiation factor IF-1
VTDQIPIATTSSHMATVRGDVALMTHGRSATARTTKLPRAYAWFDPGDNVVVRISARQATRTNVFTKISDDGTMLDDRGGR